MLGFENIQWQFIATKLSSNIFKVFVDNDFVTHFFNVLSDDEYICIISKQHG